MRAEQLVLQQSAQAKQQDKIAHLQKFIDRFKAKASKAKQAQSRVKALERMEKIAPMLADADFEFEFKEPGSLPNPMLTMSQASFGYPAADDAPEGTPPTVIVRGVNRSVLAGQRIGILGANGQGKSTLVKTVAEALVATGGEIIRGKGLNIGYFSQQELDVLRPEDDPLQHMMRLVRETPQQLRPSYNDCREQGLRNFLGTFNFSGDMVKQAVGSMLVCITGVSGSGKSTLINDTLYKIAARELNGASEEPAPYQDIVGLNQLDKVISVDQSPIGRTPRSNPATYTGLFTPIRELFSGVPLSRERGYGPGRFSFNVKGGRCEACQGDGVIKVEMHFLPDIYVPCDVCRSKRYNRETLEVLYKGKSIDQVLQLTVEQAREFFDAVPSVARKLQTLLDVGLGYIRLGQSATTLSGGEAQRVKLGLELSKRDTGRTLYILDEPTTGLHFHGRSIAD